MSDTATLEPDTIERTDTDLEDAFRSIVDPDNEESINDSDGDHERFSHYASKEDIARSAVSRQPIVAPGPVEPRHDPVRTGRGGAYCIALAE